VSVIQAEPPPLSRENATTRGGPIVHLGALLLYAFVTLVVAFPLVGSFTDHLAAPLGRGPQVYLEEASQFIWYDWWIDESLLVRHVSPFRTDRIFAPVGINLAPQDNSPFSALTALPVTATLGAIAGFNFSLFVGTILTGYGAFLLARYLLKENVPALVAGLAIALAPARLAEAYIGHPNIANVEWIPFFFLALLRLLRGEGRWRAPLAGLMLFLVGLSSLELLVMTGLATLVILGYEFYQDRQLPRRALGQLVIAAVVFLVLFTPLVLPALPTLRADTLPRPPLAQDITYSIRPQMFFTPFWDRRDFDGDVIFGRNPAFIGWVVGLLGVIAVLRSRDRGWRLWGLLGLVFAILTLGPVLKLSPLGPVRFTLLGRHLGIPLPFLVVRLLPLMSEFRTPERLGVITFLALAILAGYGARQLLAELAARFDPRAGLGRAIQVGVPIILGAVLVAEAIAVGLPTQAVPQTTAYRVIAADPGDPVVLTLPLGWTSGTEWFGQRYGLGGGAMYFDTVHGKRIINGLMPRVPTHILNYYRGYPLLRYLVNPFQQSPGADATDPQKVAQQLRELQVGYIAIERYAYTPAQLAELQSYLTRTMSATLASQDEETIIYRVNPR